MTVRFGFGVGPTTVNRMAVIYFCRIMTCSFVSRDMFSVLIVHNNSNCLGCHLADIIPFVTMRIYKNHDLN